MSAPVFVHKHEVNRIIAIKYKRQSRRIQNEMVTGAGWAWGWVFGRSAAAFDGFGFWGQHLLFLSQHKFDCFGLAFLWLVRAFLHNDSCYIYNNSRNESRCQLLLFSFVYLAFLLYFKELFALFCCGVWRYPQLSDCDGEFDSNCDVICPISMSWNWFTLQLTRLLLRTWTFIKMIYAESFSVAILIFCDEREWAYSMNLKLFKDII